MEIGKLPNNVLEKIIFENIKTKRDEVLVGAEIGEDNAIIDFGENICVLSTDPITGSTKDIGHLAIHISCNDVASSGAEPIAVLLTILAPPTTEEDDLRKVMKDASRASRELNIEIAGGHTEITDAVNQLVLSTTVIGRQKKLDRIDKSRIKVGDKLLVSKKIGIEGTSILAKELEDKLSKFLSQEEIDHAKNMDKDLSVLREGRIASRLGVNYMHDITEGGVMGAVWEAGEAVGYGMEIDLEAIPIDDVTKKIASLVEIDPYRLISSGSMLMIASDDRIDLLKKEMAKEDIDLSIIGEIKTGDRLIKKNGEIKSIEAPASDELYRGLEYFN